MWCFGVRARARVCVCVCATVCGALIKPNVLAGAIMVIFLGTCKIRRAFTMKRQPPDTSDSPDEFTSEQLETIPASLQFSSTVNYVTQVCSVLYMTDI